MTTNRITQGIRGNDTTLPPHNHAPRCGTTFGKLDVLGASLFQVVRRIRNAGRWDFCHSLNRRYAWGHPIR